MPLSSLPLLANICLGIVILITYPSYSSALQKYVQLNPNGANAGRPPVAAIGHLNPQGDGPNNQYGKDFSQAGHTWTKTLCLLDSDGDGYTNGFELGDPCCVWVEGKGDPAYTQDISLPGLKASVPAARKCSNVTCTNGVNPCINPSPTPTPSPSPTHHNGTVTPSPSHSGTVNHVPSSMMVILPVILSLVLGFVMNTFQTA